MMFGEIPVPSALGVSLVMLVASFCWCWRERCRRTSVKEIEHQRHKDRVALLKEYGKLLSDGKLAADDLLLIARLERIQLPNEIEAPAVTHKSGT